MAISQTTITGSFITAKGVPAPITEVVFQLKGSDYEDGQLIVIKEVSAETIDTEAGTFSATLWPNDRGMRGNTSYSVVFRFSDGSKVTGVDNIVIRHSANPVTLEDVEVETKLLGAVAPYKLVILRQSEYDALPALAAGTLYLVKGA